MKAILLKLTVSEKGQTLFEIAVYWPKEAFVNSIVRSSARTGESKKPQATCHLFFSFVATQSGCAGSHYVLVQYLKHIQFLDSCKEALKCVSLWRITEDEVGHGWNKLLENRIWKQKRVGERFWMEHYAGRRTHMSEVRSDYGTSLFYSVLYWSTCVLFTA